jgi:hypothetical protein
MRPVEALTGRTASRYVGAWMRAGGAGYGLNGRRVASDARASARSSVARARLSRATLRACGRVSAVRTVSHRPTRRPSRSCVRRARAATRSKPRLAAAA